MDSLKKSKKDIEDQQKRLKLLIERILKNPNKYDPVYKSLQTLFKNDSSINLNKENKIRFGIRKLALKRFMLGYPPRKKADNSIGDAINWEWIIYCAQKTGKHIIIVTRDADFGAFYDGESYLNDWLVQEFKERVSKRRKLIITDKLSTAFKLVDIEVTKEMIEEEEKVIDLSTFSYKMNLVQNAIIRANESLKITELHNSLANLQNTYSNFWKKISPSFDETITK